MLLYILFELIVEWLLHVNDIDHCLVLKLRILLCSDWIEEILKD